MLLPFKCPFCGGRATADSDPPQVTHEKPTCKEFDDAPDAISFVESVNNKILGKEQADAMRAAEIAKESN